MYEIEKKRVTCNDCGQLFYIGEDGTTFYSSCPQCGSMDLGDPL